MRGEPVEPIHHTARGAGAPLLLLHGDLADGAMTWGQLTGELAAAHRVVVVDRRGHGKSPRRPQPYTIAGDARDLVELLERLSAPPVHVVAHSYGGLVALELACKAPGRVGSLHLLEPPYLSLLPRDPHVGPLNARAARIFAMAGEWGPERTAREFFTMLGGPGLAERLRDGEAWPHLVREAAALGQTQFPGTFPAAVARRLRPPGPVWVYTGAASHPALQRVAARLAEVVTGARLLTVADATHVVHRAPSFAGLLLRTVASGR